jgi:hypothetical protein
MEEVDGPNPFGPTISASVRSGDWVTECAGNAGNRHAFSGVGTKLEVEFSRR